MYRLQLLKKVYSPTLALTILYGLPFGLLTYLLSNKHDHGTIFLYLIGGLLFGILMSLNQKNRFQKVFQLAETGKADKNKTFNAYLKHVQVPESKAERQELISYMGKLEAHRNAIHNIYYSKRNAKLKVYTTLTLFFLGTLAIKHLRMLAIVYPIIMGIGLFGEYHERAIKHSIAVMRDKLKA